MKAIDKSGREVSVGDEWLLPDGRWVPVSSVKQHTAARPDVLVLGGTLDGTPYAMQATMTETRPAQAAKPAPPRYEAMLTTSDGHGLALLSGDASGRFRGTVHMSGVATTLVVLKDGVAIHSKPMGPLTHVRAGDLFAATACWVEHAYAPLEATHTIERTSPFYRDSAAAQMSELVTTPLAQAERRDGSRPFFAQSTVRSEVTLPATAALVRRPTPEDEEARLRAMLRRAPEPVIVSDHMAGGRALAEALQIPALVEAARQHWHAYHPRGTMSWDRVPGSRALRVIYAVPGTAFAWQDRLCTDRLGESTRRTWAAWGNWLAAIASARAIESSPAVLARRARREALEALGRRG